MNKTNLPAPTSADKSTRWSLIRDLTVFQLKLVLDGLKDIVLAPLSLLAGIVDLVSRSESPSRYFYRLLKFGRGYDRWVNLYGALSDRDKQSLSGLDAKLFQLESAVREQRAKGGLTAQAQHAIDRVLDALQDTQNRARPPRSDADRDDSSRS